jgi:tetratricopeptide (TPR) repeat protein
MKQLIQFLAVAFLTVVGGIAGSRAELVTRQPDSIFDVDGLMVDNAGSDVKTNEIFRVGIQQYPVVDASKPARKPQRPGIRSPGWAAGQAQDVVQANLQAADIYAKQQNWSRALAEIQQGLELDPENLLLLRKAAAFAALAKKFGVADQYFQKVLNANPNNVLFLTGRAGVLIRLLRLKEADELVRKALAIDPSFLAARFDELCVKIARGDKDIPVGGWDMLTFEEVIDLVNWLDADKQDYIKAMSPEGYNKLCEIALGPGTDARVTEIASLLRKASLAHRGGQWADSEAALVKVKDAGVRAIGVEATIGRCLYEKGDKSAALARFKAMADQYPKVSSVLYDYSFVLINMELYSQASKVLERVCELNPQDGQAAFALACSYAALGQRDQAWPILTRLTSSHADELPAWLAGNEPYLKALQKDPQYAEFQKAVQSGR